MKLTEIEAEFFLALFHLRYLTNKQAAGIWYRERGLGGAERRLRRLCENGLVSRVHIGHPYFPSAWTLTGEGIRALRRVREGEFFSFRPISPMFLPHLLQTNEVFLKLAGEEWLLDRLGFKWIGSHRSSFAYSDGVRSNRLTPDAVITPRGSGPRIFLELDRSTERIRKRDHGRTIEGKLQAYQTFFMRRPMEGLRSHPTWYHQAFPDGRSCCVAFVLAKETETKISKRNLQRRREAVLSIAAEVCPDVEVRCMVLDEVINLGSFMDQHPIDLADDPVSIMLTHQDIQALRGLLDSVHRVYPNITDPLHRTLLKDGANGARDVMARLWVGGR
jgi:hypothetical protein